MSLRKILETFIRFFPSFFNKKIRPHGLLYGRLRVGPAFCVQRLTLIRANPGRIATCHLSSCSNKNDGPRGRFNCISTVSCKGKTLNDLKTLNDSMFAKLAGRSFQS